MNKKEIENTMLEIIEDVKERDNESLLEKLSRIEEDVYDNDYVYDLFNQMIEEVSVDDDFSESVVMEYITEIAYTLNLDEVMLKVAGGFTPNKNLLYCPNCGMTIYVDDSYSECECGWTSNY